MQLQTLQPLPIIRFQSHSPSFGDWLQQPSTSWFQNLCQCPGVAMTDHHTPGGLNNRDFFSPSSGGEKPEATVWAGRDSLQRLQGRVLPRPQRWGAPGPLACGHITPVSALSPCGRLPCDCVCPLLSLIRTLVTAFRAHQGNPGSSHLN